MTNQEINTAISNVKEAWKNPEFFNNVSKSERILSSATGGYFLFKGITSVFSHPIIGLASVAIGTGLLYRAITGYCPVKDITEKEEIFADQVLVTETYVVDELA